MHADGICIGCYVYPTLHWRQTNEGEEHGVAAVYGTMQVIMVIRAG